MTTAIFVQAPKGVAAVSWSVIDREPVEWQYPPDALAEVTLAEIDAAKGVVPVPPGGRFHESTADFLDFLDQQP